MRNPTINEPTKTPLKYTASSCLAAGLCFSRRGEAESWAEKLGGIFYAFPYRGWWYLRKDSGLVTSPLYLVSID